MRPFMHLARVGPRAVYLLPMFSVAGRLPLGPARAVPRWMAVTAVGVYQRSLSPRKGFACAYRVRFDGSSCSQHFLQQLDQGGLRHGLGSLQSRLHECRLAAAGAAASSTANSAAGDHAEPHAQDGAPEADDQDHQSNWQLDGCAECGSGGCDCLEAFDVC